MGSTLCVGSEWLGQVLEVQPLRGCVAEYLLCPAIELSFCLQGIVVVCGILVWFPVSGVGFDACCRQTCAS